MFSNKTFVIEKIKTQTDFNREMLEDGVNKLMNTTIRSKVAASLP